MPGIEVVIDKLLRMAQYLDQIEANRPAEYAQYASDDMRRLALERLIQLVVDLALDVNNILSSSRNHAPASDYFNSFLDMAELGFLEEGFALAIAPSTSIRNRLVHEYEKTDDRIVFASLPKFVDMYRQYVSRIRREIG